MDSKSFACRSLALLALAGCSHELDGPAPAVQGLDPSIVCAEQITTPVTINGSGLSPLAEEALTPDPLLDLPEIKLTRTADLFGGAATGAAITIPDDPNNPAASRVRWTSQQSMGFDVYPQLGLAPGIYSVQVTNANGKTVTATQALAAVPAPVVTEIEPNPVCNAQGTSILTLTGTGFLVLGETRPTVTIDGMPATITAMDGCVALVGTRVPAQICTSIEISVPQGTLTTGEHQVSVTNPAPAGCSTNPTFTLTVVPPPTITNVQPAVICAGGADLVITGTNFSPDARVFVGDVEATVTSSTPTRIEATLGPIDPGIYDVVVDNQDGCTATREDGLTVTPGPAVFFVDPPTVYNGISIQATIYVTGLLGAPSSVTIEPAGGGTSRTLESTFDPARPNRILAVVPAGLAAGDYDVNVFDGVCQATLPSGLHVVSELSVAIADITPPFGWTSDDTAVTITATSPPPTGQTQFQATPRVYLNPTSGTGLARPLAGVAFVNAARLTALVDSGLTPGDYDLIVVNPDRTVGLLGGSFRVTAANAPPPLVETITPGSVVNQPGQQVTILGSGFRSPEVTATCADDDGSMEIIDATGVTATGTSIGATFNMGVLSSAVCVVRVTNADGTFVDFSALAVSNPAQNLPATVSDQAMAVPRRALAAAAARVTSQARYLFAIGGDDGTDAGLLASIEAAPVSLFGELDAFFTLPGALPAGRSQMGSAVIGRFVYLVGGRVAAGATDSVLRAQILDPRAAPELTDLDFSTSEGDGLTPDPLRPYYYRVSAVMAAGDASNPGGETLASDPLGVIVPPLPGVRVTLIWAAVPGAASYRVYRTPAAGDAVGAVRLVGTVTTTRFTDAGATAMAGVPLPEGSLGAWHEVGPMPSAREGAGVAVAADPDDEDAFFLYAIGGRGAAGATTATYTFARVAVGAGGAQTVSDFSADAAFLDTGRWQLGAIGMDHARASVVPEGETWVYALTGYNAARTTPVREASAGKVTGDGTLTPVFDVDAANVGGGYGLAGANNFLFVFGGDTSATSSALSGKLCMPGEGGCGGQPPVPEPPEIVNWNALGFGLRQARYLPGSALESAFIFLVGGASDTAAATATTERTHW